MGSEFGQGGGQFCGGKLTDEIQTCGREGNWILLGGGREVLVVGSVGILYQTDYQEAIESSLYAVLLGRGRCVQIKPFCKGSWY